MQLILCQITIAFFGIRAQKFQPHMLILLEVFNRCIIFLLESLIYLNDQIILHLCALDLSIQIFSLLLFVDFRKSLSVVINLDIFVSLRENPVTMRRADIRLVILYDLLSEFADLLLLTMSNIIYLTLVHNFKKWIGVTNHLL